MPRFESRLLSPECISGSTVSAITESFAESAGNLYASLVESAANDSDNNTIKRVWFELHCSLF